MKKFKGFTLIELIIVMAILSILMAAILQMFKPIRSTYVDATLYENQRTAQNGMTRYITESVRFSTDLGLYTSDKASSAGNAVEKFTVAYLEANGVYGPGNSEGKTPDADYTAKYNNTLDAMQKNAEIVIIDHSTGFDYNNVSGWKGRILRRKIIPDSSDPTDKTKYKKITDSEYGSSGTEDYTKKGWRLALGAPYYGGMRYTILLEDGDTTTGNTDWTAKDGIKVTVSSYSKLKRTNSGITESGALVSTSGQVVCKNQDAPINGMFDVDNFTATTAASDGTKVYIVFINEKIKITA